MAGITPSRGIPLVRVNSGTITALTAGIAVDLNIVARNQTAHTIDRIPPRLAPTSHPFSGSLHGTIEDVVFYVVASAGTAPHITLSWWGNDQHNTTNLANVKLWGQEDLTQGDFAREGSGVTTSIWRAYVGGLAISYDDLDNTGEFHVTVENNSSTNIASGKSRFEFGFRPEFGA